MIMLVQNTPTTGDLRIDALLGTLFWSVPGTEPLQVTYSFPGTGSLWPTADGEYTVADPWGPLGGFAELMESQKDAARAALASWAAMANVVFVEVADDAGGSGTLRFAWTASPVDEQAHTFSPETTERAGDVWLNSLAPWDGFAAGTYGYSTLVHEIGHALGLKHSFEGTAVLPAAEDGYASTIMSYTADAGRPGSWVEFEPATPMLYDNLAIQALYGANTGHRSGDDTYVFVQGQRYFQTLWDAAGNDTIVWQASTQGARVDLNAGHFSQLGEPLAYWSANFTSSWNDLDTVAIAYGVQIENAFGGGGNDTLIGTATTNVLKGNAGNDIIDGKGGNDVVDGGAGVDTLILNVDTLDVLATGYQFAPGLLSQVGSSLGIVELTGIERVQLSDGLYAFDTLASSGTDAGGKVWQAAALYWAGFGAMADQTVLSQWTAEADVSADMGDLGQAMIDSYAPGVSDAALVTHLYFMLTGVLPPGETVQSFVDLIGPGRQFETQGDIFAFAASLAENTVHMVDFVGSIQTLDPGWFPLG